MNKVIHFEDGPCNGVWSESGVLSGGLICIGNPVGKSVWHRKFTESLVLGFFWIERELFFHH